MFKFLNFKNLSNQKNLLHFITTRSGGVSVRNYAGLNLALHVNDKKSSVLKNRKVLAEELGINTIQLTFAEQVHGGRVVVVKNGQVGSGTLKNHIDAIKGADALITNIKNACLTVLTADCVSVLLFDPKKQVIGVAHAGWRGTAKNIVQNTVLEMKKEFGTNAKDLLVGIGPAICEKCFNVDKKTAKKFNKKFVTETKGEFLVDLIGENINQLVGAGAKKENIENLNICTKENAKDFYSARANGINTGRIASGIMLK